MSDRIGDPVVDHLLGEQDEVARADAERRIAADPALRAEWDRLAPVVRALASAPRDAFDPPVPPPLALPRADAAAAPAPSPIPRRRRWAPLARPVAVGLAAAALVAAGVGIGRLASGDPSPAGTQVALNALDPAMPAAAGSALVDARDERMRLSVSGLAPSAPGSHYELWLIRPGTTRMVSLGGFRVPADGRATVDVDLPVSPRRYRLIDVSVEPDDGNPTHSGRSVLRSRAA